MTQDSCSVAVVVASYNPGPQLLATVQTFTAQSARVLVVDDASTERSAHDILASCEKAGATVVKNSVNGGIGRSLNAGVAWAETIGSKYLVTMDQDTIVEADYVSNSIAYFSQLVENQIDVGLVAPSRMNGNLRVPNFPHGNVSVGIDVMQSASMFDIEVFREFGRFREDFFIDCIDTEFCLRLRANGRSIVWNPNTSVRHSVGDASVVRVLGRPARFRGRTLTTSNHAPFRRYYMARNRLATARLYARKDPQWRKHALPKQLKDTLVAFLFESQRVAKFRAVVVGTFDGLRGKTGVR